MSGGNSRVDEDLRYLIPSIPVVKDPETGEEYGISELPCEIRSDVADPSAPGGKRRIHLPMRNQVIVPPSEAMKRRIMADHNCLTCRFFDQKNAQVELARNQFFTRLIEEHNWEEGWLGVPKEHYGLCGASGGEIVVSPLGGTECDQWRPGKGGFSMAISKSTKVVGDIAEWLFKPERG